MSALPDFPVIDESAVAAPLVAPAANLPAAQAVTVKAAVLALFAPMETDLRALAEKYRACAFDVASPKGLKAAKEARHELREAGRYAVQRLRDDAKDRLNEGKKVAESEAERLIAIVKPAEDAIDAQITVREKQIEEEKQREAARQQKYLDEIAKIKGWATQAAARPLPPQRLADGIILVESIDTSAAAFEEFAGEAEQAKQATLTTLRQLLVDAQARERDERISQALQAIQSVLMSCIGKPAAFIDDCIAKLAGQVYSEEVGQRVLDAHSNALQQLAALRENAVIAEEMRRQQAAEKAAAEAAKNTPSEGANRDASTGRSHGAEGSASPNGRGTNGAPARGYAPVFSSEPSPEAGEAPQIHPLPEAEAAPGMGNDAFEVPNFDEPVAQPDDVHALVADLLQHAAIAWRDSRFPTQPKPGPEWWAGLRERVERLQPLVFTSRVQS